AGTYHLQLSSDADLTALRARADFQALLQQEAVPTDSAKRFAAGLGFQRLAEQVEAGEDAVGHYEKAIDQYRQAVDANREFYQAQFMWADCLLNLARRAPGPTQRRALLRESRE